MVTGAPLKLPEGQYGQWRAIGPVSWIWSQKFGHEVYINGRLIYRSAHHWRSQDGRTFSSHGISYQRLLFELVAVTVATVVLIVLLALAYSHFLA